MSNSNLDTVLDKSNIIGIDFGMTNTSISYITNSNEIKLIPNELGHTIIPTTVEITKNGMSFFHRYFKRSIGENKVSQDLTIQFLKKIKSISENYLNKSISCCVISSPVYFSFIDNKTLSECCEKAGFKVLSIIPEPIAAVLSISRKSEFNFANKNIENYFITIDCGGGTIDLSFVSFDHETNFFDVLTTLGNNNLGGEDLTQNLVGYIKTKYDLNTYSETKLYNKAKKTKEILSYKFQNDLILDDIDKIITVSQNEFITCNNRWFQEFRELLSQFKTQIQEYHIDIRNIDIILVGGTTKTPYIKQIVKNVFNESIFNLVNSNAELYNSVAIGCSLMSKIIVNEKNNNDDKHENPVLLQKINNSIGVEVEDGKMAVVISKDSYIPISKSITLTNTDEEDLLTVSLFSGERKYVKDNHFIGQVNIPFLEKKKRGEHKINLNVSVNDWGNKLELNITTSDTSQIHSVLQFQNKKHKNENIVQLFEELIHDNNLENN